MFLKVNQSSLIYSKLFAAIATEGLPTGVYIVKSQSVNLKFAKK